MEASPWNGELEVVPCLPDPRGATPRMPFDRLTLLLDAERVDLDEVEKAEEVLS